MSSVTKATPKPEIQQPINNDAISIPDQVRDAKVQSVFHDQQSVKSTQDQGKGSNLSLGTISVIQRESENEESPQSKSMGLNPALGNGQSDGLSQEIEPLVQATSEQIFASQTPVYAGLTLTAIFAGKAILAKTALKTAMMSLGAVGTASLIAPASYACFSADITDVTSLPKKISQSVSLKVHEIKNGISTEVENDESTLNDLYDTLTNAPIPASDKHFELFTSETVFIPEIVTEQVHAIYNRFLSGSES